MLRAGARPLLLQLVDIFYGGKGALAKEREELTDAEDRFAARLGRDIGEQLAAAWTETLAIEPQLDCVTRSEEHTSELQSLMRISYAVFCLKKKHIHNYKKNKANTAL